MSVLQELPPPRPRGRAITPVELFTDARDPVRRAGRDIVRRAALAMLPNDATDVHLPGPLGPADGVFWGVRSRNGLSVAIRAASFRTDAAATRDSTEIVARSAEWEVCGVSNRDRTVQSLWLLLDGRVVLVAGQSWRSSTTAAGTVARRILAALPQAL